MSRSCAVRLGMHMAQHCSETKLQNPDSLQLQEAPQQALAPLL